MAKIGRNDKCPCGSGKKYKNCCMLKDENDKLYTNEIGQYIKAETYMTNIIMKYIKSKENSEDFNKAIIEFFGKEISELDITESEFGIFMSWYIKNYNMENNLLDRVLNSIKGRISSDVETLFRSLKNSNLYLYQVIEAKDRKAVFENLHNGERIEVIDEVLERNVNVGDIVYSRFYEVGNKNRIFGGSMFVAPEIVEELTNEANMAWENTGKQKDFKEFLQEYSLEIIKKISSAGIEDKVLYNENGEILQYAVTKYKINESEKCKVILEGLFSKLEENVYQWIQKLDNKEILMGEITIENNMLSVETDSFERKESLQNILEENLKDIVTFEDEQYVTLYDLNQEIGKGNEKEQSSDKVERLVFDKMKVEYKPLEIKKALLLIKENKDKFKKVKPESIAAAIEYIVASELETSKTQKDIADKYEVSVTTLAKWAKELNN